jgi:hypothetical protein
MPRYTRDLPEHGNSPHGLARPQDPQELPIHQSGTANRTATALFPHWNRITAALEPHCIPSGIESWKSRPPSKPPAG